MAYVPTKREIQNMLEDSGSWDAIKMELRELFLDMNNGGFTDKEKIERVHKFFEPWIDELFPDEPKPANAAEGK